MAKGFGIAQLDAQRQRGLMSARRQPSRLGSPGRFATQLLAITLVIGFLVGALSALGAFTGIEWWLTKARLNWHTWDWHPDGPGREASPFPGVALLLFDRADLLAAGADAERDGQDTATWHDREQLQWMVMRSLEILADLASHDAGLAPGAVGLDFYNLGVEDDRNAEIVSRMTVAAQRLENVVDGYRITDATGSDTALASASRHGFLDLLPPVRFLVDEDTTQTAALWRRSAASREDQFSLGLAICMEFEARMRHRPGWNPGRVSFASWDALSAEDQRWPPVDRVDDELRLLWPIMFLPPRSSGTSESGSPARRSAFPVLHFRDMLQLGRLLKTGDPAEWPGLGTVFGRALLVGIDLPDVDRIRTPYSNRLHGSQEFPGVEVHAQIVCGLLNGWVLRPLDRFLPALNGVLLLGLMFVSAWGAGRLAFGWSIVAGALLLVGLLLVDAALWHFGRITLPLTQWLVGISMANRSAAQLLARRERRSRDLVMQRLSQHVTERVAHHLVHSPLAGELGGERREVTVLFSDLQGFTSLTERLPPEVMLALMNRYLDAMSGEIAAEGGTLANYIGDAIFAIFGAPDALPDHARRAVNAAIRMQQALSRFNLTITAEGHAPLAQRIGLSTGQVICGNVGGTRRFIWTALGDAVPIGARLEPLNKQYGTGILMTQATCAQLGPEYNVQLVDSGIRVRGRQGLLDIYTVEVPPCEGG